MLEVGIKGHQEMVVTDRYTAKTMGSGVMDVFATPVASSPIGMKITCDSKLVAIEGRKLVFSVEAYDAKGLIGKGTHERFIIESKKFQEKTDRKLEG